MRVRIRSIYTKLLLSFFTLLILEVLLMVLWSSIFVSSEISNEEVVDIEAQAMLMSMALREAAATAPDTPPAENPRVLAVLEEFENFYQADGWLVDNSGAVVYSSNGAGLPDVSPIETHEMKNITLMELNAERDTGEEKLYVLLPTDMGKWGQTTLHALFPKNHNASDIGKSIILGQLLVALVIGLLIFPVSRFITIPMRRLQTSVLHYAGGDLTSRFTHTRGDEIGELGDAFNVMANNLENMIRGGRELMANVSHELRSPLARMRISEEMLRDRIKQRELQDSSRHLDCIREEVDHLDGLIGRMLEITRVDLHEAEKQPERVDLSQLTRRMAARYDTLKEHHNIKFTVAVTEGLLVMGNTDALVSVLTNLLDNAFKYCSTQGTVRLTLGKAHDGKILLQVDNTHPPLAPADLETMFEPFHRLNATRQGYGLGLAIVRKIIHKHGGLVHAEHIQDSLRIEATLRRMENMDAL